ncbi:hypothetical protein [Streptomyces daliensis]
MTPRPRCEVDGGDHVGPVMRYLPTARYPWHNPVWLCPWHGAYLPLAAIRADVTGETVARAITVFTGAGKRRTDTEPDPKAAPALHVVRNP